MTRSQHNAWIHAGATVAVVAAGLLCHATGSEWALLTLAMAGVWAAEAFNTAIEALGNAVSAAEHPLVGVAKDVSAGAVLVTAVGAAIVGGLVFVPKLAAIIGRG